MYTFIAQKHAFVQIFARYVNLWSVTTRVCVVYMLNKHIHALKLLVISIIMGVFTGRVCVWRLILKKSSLVVSLCHNSKSVIIPLQNCSKSVPKNGRKMGLT